MADLTDPADPVVTHRVLVELDRPPMTANQQRAWHRWKMRACKYEAEMAVFAYARKCGLPKPLGPSHVSVTWFAPDRRRRDPDSLGPFMKASLDALVAYGCWPDDNSTWVLSTSMTVTPAQDQGREPCIEILIKPEER